MRSFLIATLILGLIVLSFIAGIGFGAVVGGGKNLSGGPRVAVLRIEGVIIDSQPYLDSLSEIEKSNDIKAIVVRIDSPGGAVSPSQEIYSEVKRAREKLPIVASMGTVSASGGYYIACAAEKIFANPGTITGSIGVIAEFVSYKQLLEWAKLDVEVIKSGEFKDIGSPLREMTDSERQYIQALIDNTHSQFKRAVSDGRGIALDTVNGLADGRVFTGEQARDLKLVDELGTIRDAVRLAGKMGGIEEKDPEIVYYPKSKTRFLDLLLSNVSTYIPGLKERFGLFYLINMI